MEPRKAPVDILVVDRVLSRDIDAVARPQRHGIAALLGDETEAIPLGLKHPVLVVERFVDKCCQHRSIGGIYTFFLIRCSPYLGSTIIASPLAELVDNIVSKVP